MQTHGNNLYQPPLSATRSTLVSFAATSVRASALNSIQPLMSTTDDIHAKGPAGGGTAGAMDDTAAGAANPGSEVAAVDTEAEVRESSC